MKIKTAEELRKTGSRDAWLKIKAIDPSACYNRLCGLEGALRGIRWHNLPDETKKELKDFYNSFKQAGFPFIQEDSLKGLILQNASLQTNLRRLRAAAGLSQRELTSKMNLLGSTIDRNTYWRLFLSISRLAEPLSGGALFTCIPASPLPSGRGFFTITV